MPSTLAVNAGGGAPLLELPDANPGGGALASRPSGGSEVRLLAPRATASGPAKATAAKKTSTKATTKGASSAKKTAGKAASGYATKLPADYAFLRDPKLSIEEKLSRFIGLVMTRSEQDLLRQMEKMAPGSTAAGSAGQSGASGGAGGATASKPKTTKVTLWGLAKTLLPPLGLASKLIGDAQLKAMLTQVSGPVLAAAATAAGLPQLAPLAVKFGPTLVGALSKDIGPELAALTGGGGKSTSGAGGATGGGTTKATSGGGGAGQVDGSTSEKAQLMELQRLQDRDKELFMLFSNMLKAMHDARMTSIQNIR